MSKNLIANRVARPLLALVLACGLGGNLIGCEDATSNDEHVDPTDNNKPAPQPGEVRSEKQRVANPDVSQPDREALVAGNTAFALDLYHRISGDDQNLFYSPFSISEALAMTYAGARGETAAQMADTLHLNPHQDRVHPGFNWLDAHLMNLGEQPVNEGSEAFELAVANSIWGQNGFHFEAEFLDTLALHYGAGLNVMDFIGAPEESRETINQWVEQQTNERIKNLLPEGSVDANTRMVLTNAIYFKASWLYAFEESATATGAFTRRDDSTVDAAFMEQTTHLRYAQLPGYKAVELPYDGGDVSMLVLLPEDLEAFEQNLSPQTLDATLGALQTQTVHLKLPKFEFTRSLPLGSTLKEMGMHDAFGPGADFSGMTGAPDLQITGVLHKAFVSVDEEGTEAAAATAVVVGTTSVPADPLEFHADQPFIFMIRANQTGSLLFVGRVLDPSVQD